MKAYFLVFSLLLFFSFSLEAQTTKRVNKKPKVEQKKTGKLKGNKQVVDHKADDQKVRRGTPRVVDHKADDQKVRRGTPRVVDHKADDQKLRKGRTGNRKKLKRGNISGRKVTNKTGARNRTAAKRKTRNN
jgi:hypothetical protein